MKTCACTTPHRRKRIVLTGGPGAGKTAVLEATDIPVIASGGGGALADLETLTPQNASGRTLEGAIVGKALYEGNFTVEEAISACGQ